MGSEMYTPEEAAGRIETGRPLLLAGDEAVLEKLPAGNWIGGSSAFFMTHRGGLLSQEQVCVTELPDLVESVSIQVYDSETLVDVYRDIPENGFAVAILPGMSWTHFEFALKAPGYVDFAMRPLIGWIAGVRPEELGRRLPKVYDGRTPTGMTDGAVVMRVHLPPGKVAEVGIFNLFEPGDGDLITFPESGFSAETALVNGERVNFAQYAAEKKLDQRLPLVADYYGVKVNISFQSVDPKAGQVKFFAPVFPGVEYRQARPVGAYVEEFTSRMPREETGKVAFACNCVLNYLYSELEGKVTPGITGPITFGEIAYQLLNQTLTYIRLEDASG
jgi:hypothetical protein